MTRTFLGEGAPHPSRAAGLDPPVGARLATARPPYDASDMTPALLLTLLLSCLLATLPVRRLNQAGWSSGALFTAWIVYVVGILLGLDVGVGSKYLLPVLAILFVLPFMVSQSRLERVGRLFGSRRAVARPEVINVTPPGDAAVAEPTKDAVPRRRGRKPPVEYR